MTVTVAAASSYSINGASEVCYQVDYSDGTQVRAVFSAGGWARKEYKDAAGQWRQSGRPYIVRADKRRQAESLRATVQEWLTK